MKVPGANLLKLAAKAISLTSVGYIKYVQRNTNSVGQWVTKYADAVPTQASVQPVDRKLFAQMGLSFEENYYNVWVPRGVIDIARDSSGDKFSWNGTTLQVLSKTPWCPIDGWDAVLTVDIASKAKRNA